MALPWSIISVVDFSTGHIAEDVKLGIDLAMCGYEPLFCPGARVTSHLPATLQGSRVQRTRWEHGHLALICEYVPRLLLSALKTRRLSLFAIALDLSILPVGLFVLVIIALTAGALATVDEFSIFSLFITAPMLPLFALAIGLAWFWHGRDIVSARDLLSAPIYAFFKNPYFSAISHQTSGRGLDP